MAHLLSLPPEILLNILRHLPKYSTLLSAIQSCKAINRLYRSHSNSVLWSIGVMLCGGSDRVALQAVCAIRIKHGLDLPEELWAGCADTKLLGIVNDAFGDATAEKRVVRPKEARQLIYRVNLARQLETIFSARHKDRLTAAVSTLSVVETVRFRLAFHRVEILLALSRRHHAANEWKNPAKRHRLFFSRFSNEDIFHMYEVFALLDAIRMEASIGHPRSSDELYTIQLGIEGILFLFNQPWAHNPKSARIARVSGCFEDFYRRLAPGVNAANLERSISRPPKVLPIVMEPLSVEHECCTCQNVSNLTLCHISYWRNWPRCFRLNALPCFLGGQLPYNKYECSAFLHYLGLSTDVSNTVIDLRPSHQPASAPLRICNIVSALYELKMDDGWDILSPDDWICAFCLRNLIESRLWVWWALVKDKVDVEDCKFGVDCLNQTRGPSHAQRYNHACPDISDPYVRLVAAAEARLASGGDVVDAVDDLEDNDQTTLLWRCTLADVELDPDDAIVLMRQERLRLASMLKSDGHG